MSVLKGNMLTSNNRKLGSGVWQFNLPVFKTCPGLTDYCKRVCYARHGTWCYDNVRRRYASNFIVSKSDSFVELINKELKNQMGCYVRLHSSGDFYSPEYTRKWIEIVRANPTNKFWGYTRSWGLNNKFEKALWELRELKNVNLFASFDDTTDRVPDPSWRTARIVDRKATRKEVGFICLVEEKKRANCAVCGWCFKSKKGDIAFKLH